MCKITWFCWLSIIHKLQHCHILLIKMTLAGVTRSEKCKLVAVDDAVYMLINSMRILAKCYICMNCHLLYVCQYFGSSTVNWEHSENRTMSWSRNWKRDKMRKDWCVEMLEVNKLNVCQNYSLFTRTQTASSPFTTPWVDHHHHRCSIISSKLFQPISIFVQSLNSMCDITFSFVVEICLHTIWSSLRIAHPSNITQLSVVMLLYVRRHIEKQEFKFVYIFFCFCLWNNN